MPAGVIVLSLRQWEKIEQRLKEEYANTPSVMLLRSRTREVLGFTTRLHKAWIENNDYKKQRLEYDLLPRDSALWQLAEPYKGNTEYQVHLDFYNSSQETFFRLKYL
jgi:hypothetical protein